MARRGEGPELPPDLAEMIRLHDLVELTGWTIPQIEETPAVICNQLLLVRTAGILASRPKE